MTDIVQFEPETIFEKIRKLNKDISSTKTPKNKVKLRPDGLNYVEEAYMRQKLDEHFPMWSWDEGHFHFLGSEWVVVSGTLTITFAPGVVKKFYSVGSVRIQFKKNSEHVPENIIDIDKNVASANTNAFKRAVNRLTHIADDIYKKMDPDIDEIAQDELLTKVDKVKDDYKRSLWRKNIADGKINAYNVEEFKIKLDKELEFQDAT